MQDKGTETLEGILNQRVRARGIQPRRARGRSCCCRWRWRWPSSVWVTRYLSSQVGKANAVFARMAQGRFDSVVGEQPGDELGVLLTSLDQMQTNLREKIEAERKVGMENARIRQSLDATSANVMVADENLNIIYTNRAAQAADARLAGRHCAATCPTSTPRSWWAPTSTCSTRTRRTSAACWPGLSKTHTSELKIGG